MLTVISFHGVSVLPSWRLSGLMFALCWIICARAQEADTAPSSRMVEVDGYQVHVRSAGLAGRKAGAPLIVMEAGLSNSLEVWVEVFPNVARAAPVVAYDRAGLGRSAWDNQTPTPQHVTARLRKMLQQIGAGPPYVLVGYSWGGVLMRYFAGSYPDDVAGIVYVDPGPIITQSLADEVAPFDSVGAGKEGYNAYWSFFGAMIERRSTAAKAEFQVLRSLMTIDRGDRGLQAVPRVPAVVLLSAKPFPPFLKVDYDQNRHYEVDVRHRIRLLQNWALSSPDGTFVVSNQTTHAIPKEDPQLIVWAINRVLSALQTATK